MTEKRRKKVAWVIVLGVAILCFYFLNANKQASNDRAALMIQELEDASERHQAEKAAQLKVDSQAREIFLSSISDAELRRSGEQCVSVISSKMNTSATLGWDYIDFSPFEFDGLKTSVVMGLEISAYGSETSGPALVEAQIAMFEEKKVTIGNPDQFRFIVSERRDSFSGVKQVLTLHVCRIVGPDRVEAYEADKVVL